MKKIVNDFIQKKSEIIRYFILLKLRKKKMFSHRSDIFISQ